MTREVGVAGVEGVDAGRPEVGVDEEAVLGSPPGSSSSVRWSSTSSGPCSSYAGQSSMASSSGLACGGFGWRRSREGRAKGDGGGEEGEMSG